MRNFRTFVLSGTLVALMGSAAMAADLPQRSEPPPPAPAALPIFTWTGFYVGANFGGGWVQSDRVELFANGAPAAVPNNFGNAKGSGILGGVQAGYNWQVNNIVLGVETDFQGASIHKSVLGPGGVRSRARINWFGTLRGRVGYAWDQTLLYATGGLAYTDVGYRIGAPIGTLINRSSTRFGWTLGAGVEHAFNQNWTAKLEYLYVDTGKYRPTGFNGGVWSTKATQNFHVVRVGLNYKF